MGKLTPAELAEAGAPVLYSPAEAAVIIGQTENWMKTQARRGKIPFSRFGRKVMFSPADLAETARAAQQKPVPVLVPRTPARRQVPGKGTATGLQARTPRRKRTAA